MSTCTTVLHNFQNPIHTADFRCLLPHVFSHCVHSSYDTINVHLSQILTNDIVSVNAVRIFYLQVSNYQLSSSFCGYTFCNM